MDALLLMQRKGYLLFVVTNQPAAAKGKTTYTKLCEINRAFLQNAEKAGVHIEQIAMCPHYSRATPQTKEHYLVHDCNCRKPKTGLLEHILSQYKIETKSSWMVGDSASDIQCGRRIGLRTAFLGTYKCDVCMRMNGQKPNQIYSDLNSFAQDLPYVTKGQGALGQFKACSAEMEV